MKPLPPIVLIAIYFGMNTAYLVAWDMFAKKPGKTNGLRALVLIFLGVPLALVSAIGAVCEDICQSQKIIMGWRRTQRQLRRAA